jgi:hypothetical protein
MSEIIQDIVNLLDFSKIFQKIWQILNALLNFVLHVNIRLIGCFLLRITIMHMFAILKIAKHVLIINNAFFVFFKKK